MNYELRIMHYELCIINYSLTPPLSADVTIEA